MRRRSITLSFRRSFVRGPLGAASHRNHGEWGGGGSRTVMALSSEPLSERSVQLAVLLAFASGVLVGWQANRVRRRYLDWRKRRLQDQLAATQKKLDLS
ncbi:hypothetical protein JRQ81_005078 [Phrynocephalus forsythii]|uniref:Mitoregulin n=1 Tax=Phrynocephalus forsythii TaxID=171643 RepID=A0A9Q0Y3A1_9SAUR|nr:hypothetical protein JRQ81_005078 [Phrynocephalus forsythii]